MDELPPLFAAGQRLGRYQLLRRLAVGGMAEVYLASAAGPGDFRKVVAIKRLLPQHALDPQLLRMFLDEARLMARLSHPNVPQVTDVDDGGGGGVPYFVMEYIHGTDLRGVLNATAGPLPLEQALTITAAVAAGLHHAHEHRGASGQAMEIVHRDVSPSNVLISFDGGVKITDFGVAKWAEQKSLTHHGQLKGKFAHMSPEQCRGEPLDRRSDVFALGTLLYEMTTGRAPFSGESEYDLLTQIVSKDVPAPRRPGEIYPAQLEAIVMKALRRDRDGRYASTQELQLDLEAFARERRLVVSPVALAGYLEPLFGAQVTEWRAALASGKSLVDHLGAQSLRVDGGCGDADDRITRTATDLFATAVSPAPTASPAPNGPDGPDAALAVDARARSTTGEASLVRRGIGVPRAVVWAAAAVIASALLIAATELTSRWQRASQMNLSGRTPLPNSAGPGFATSDSSGIAGGGRGTPTATVSSTVPVLAPAVAPAAAPVGAKLPPAPAPRRGREAAARAARREAPASITVARATGVPSPPGTASPSLPPPVTTPAPAPIPAPAPVKVWDPDSPVPP